MKNRTMKDIVEQCSFIENKIRILLVEDNPGDAELVRVVLEQNVQAVIEVVQSSRLADAIRFLNSESFHTIVLDLGLPDSQGLDTLDRILKASPSVPVVVLTGREDPSLAEITLQMGARGCLCKHRVSGELLVKTVSRSVTDF